MASHDPNPPDREARIQRLMREIERELRQGLPEPDQTLEQIEQQVVEIGRGYLINRLVFKLPHIVSLAAMLV